MAEHVSGSHLAKLSFTVSRPRNPFVWRYMRQDVTKWSAVCHSGSHALFMHWLPKKAVSSPETVQLDPGGSGKPHSRWKGVHIIKKWMQTRSALPPPNASPVVRPSCCTGAQFACISEQFQSSRHKGVSWLKLSMPSIRVERELIVE